MQECNKADCSPDPVLDAAHATVLDFGLRRTTLTEVAKRAGLSRMTVYRRYADAPELMRALMTREFGAVIARAEAEAEAAGIEDGHERIVTAVVLTFEALTEHPLMLRLLEVDPEVLLPYVTERIGEFQRAGRTALAGWIAEAQRTGSVRAGDAEAMAAAIELAGRGVVLCARSLAPAERAGALAELRTMVAAYLGPSALGP